jgi:hypothetical protein
MASVHPVAAVHSLPAAAAAGTEEEDDDAPLPPWFPTRDAASVPVFDLRSGSYVHEARSRCKPSDRTSSGTDGGSANADPSSAGATGRHAASNHHGVAARAKVRPTFTKAVRRPVDELARSPAALPRRGKIKQPSERARQIAAQSQRAAFEARLEPLVPTSDDLIPRCGDRGPRVLNPPWGGALHGDVWADALCGGRAGVRRGDGGAFTRD